MKFASPRAIIIRTPNWIGDVVMATPALGSIRRCFPHSRITLFGVPSALSLLEGAPWFDSLLPCDLPESRFALRAALRLAGRIRSEHFDLGILFTNSFSSALLFWLGGVKRRVGYASDGRALLLTDRINRPERGRGKARMPTREYLARVANFLGCVDETSGRMELFTRENSRLRAREMLESCGASFKRPLVGLVPGSSYGPAKRWPARYFAQLADRLQKELSAEVVILVSPAEREVASEVVRNMKTQILPLHEKEMSIPLLKAVIEVLDLVVTNDTGPRHIAAAFGKPLVTIFGSSDPALTKINFEKEVELVSDVDCAPCELRNCPTDHRCMERLSPDEVFSAAKSLLQKFPPLCRPPEPRFAKGDFPS